MATGRIFNPTTPSTSPHSLWHSPLPYLFGGLAAVMGLVVLALVILACSYCRSSHGRERDVENGDGVKQEEGSVKACPKYEEDFLVIMAGDNKPTFLATPVSIWVSSIGDDKMVNPINGVEKSDKQKEAEKSQPGVHHQTEQHTETLQSLHPN